MRKRYSQEDLNKITEIAKVLGDYHNLLILIELIECGEKSFNELKRMTLINSVTLSRKLNLLKEQELVTSKQIGMENHYMATDNAMAYKCFTDLIEEIALKK